MRYFAFFSAVFATSSALVSAQQPSNYQLSQDWLVAPSSFKSTIQAQGDSITLSNGLIKRVISKRLGTTVQFQNLMTSESITRAVHPEGAVSIDGIRYMIGGADRQPNYAFLTEEWLKSMQPMKGSLKLVGFHIGEPKARLKWKKVRHYAPDSVWPPKGKYLRLDYAMPSPSGESLLNGGAATDSDFGRKLLFDDSFQKLDPSWKIHATKAHPRSSFSNEGKPGEIYTPPNTAVYAERTIPKGTALAEAKIHAGTDNSASWGPGIGLVFSNNKVMKFHLRPGGLSGVKHPVLGVFDGSSEHANVSGDAKINLTKPWLLRARWSDRQVFFDAKPEGGTWKLYSTLTIPNGFGAPKAFRVGKMDIHGGGSDASKDGGLVRLKVQQVRFFSQLDGKKLAQIRKKSSSQQQVKISVHYEIYDGIPLLSKWITVSNNTHQSINLDSFRAEDLAVVEYENQVEVRKGVPLRRPQCLHVETDMAFGGFTYRNANRHTVHWKVDKKFGTQVNWARQQPCLLHVEPTFGPDQTIKPHAEFESFRVFELVQDSEDRERRGLGIRKMYRTVAPWVTENPLMMHCVSSDPKIIRRAIDQAAETGFEMVILSFGSGFNAENSNPAYLAKWKKINDYAMSKGIHLGSYSLYSSRSAGKGNDIIPPKGMSNAHGRCPAITSDWGQTYIKKLYNLYDKTGFMVFENDGAYPGDVDTTARPPLQKGVNDSRWVHWRIWTDFYKYLRSKGVYLNLPDFYYLSGSNKCGMGYREVNWSLPREQQRIHTRQNIYDGTWDKTASMGWMFVPLTQYHGGGAAATIEPLDSHLDHYQIMMQSNLGLGVQACYRGPRLYDTPRTKAMVTNTVKWYKKHRDVLEADLIHGRRADGIDLDWMLHVNPSGKEKALLSVYNPTNKAITKTIKVPLYYSGIRGSATVTDNQGHPQKLTLDAMNRVELKVSVPAQGYKYYIFKP